MNVRLLRCTDHPEMLMSQAAAVCTDSVPTKQGMLTAINSGHLSIAEHVVFTFAVHGVSRALLAQLTRHRIASFSVESQRYVDMKTMPIIIPPSILENKEVLDSYLDLMDKIHDFYHFAVDAGIPKGDARYATPQAAQTNLIVTMNARELLHFFELRECNKAQWEIRELAKEMMELCEPYAPSLFGNAGAPCRRGACPEVRPCKDGPKV